MSVKINMKMPVSCNKCKLSSTGGWVGNVVEFQCQFTKKRVCFDYGYEYKPSWCPLKEVK